MSSSRPSAVAAVSLGGALSGIVAGLVMAICAAWWASSHDVNAWSPMLQVAAFWTGVIALVGDGWTVALGLATHLAVSMMLGIVFAALTRRDAPLLATLASGLFFSTLVWFVMTWIVLPLVDPVMYQRIRWTPEAWYLLHLAWGSGLVLEPAFERAMLRRRAPVTVDVGRPVGAPIEA